MEAPRDFFAAHPMLAVLAHNPLYSAIALIAVAGVIFWAVERLGSGRRPGG